MKRYAVDNGEFAKQISDDLIIPNAHLISVCKKGCGKNTCRYICSTPKGFICAKNTIAKNICDEQVKIGNFKAKGDNCDGFNTL